VLNLTNLIFNKEECKVATFRDVTRSKQLVKVEKDNKLLHMLSSSVTHEMVTPLKVIINLASLVQKELKGKPREHEAKLIVVSAKLMLAQVQLLLDKNKFDKNMFTPILEQANLNQAIQAVISIL
jgi:light-regulated signal transduction histidine kinase (bacteriophytochrome)